MNREDSNLPTQDLLPNNVRPSETQCERSEVREANAVIGIGAGVGAVGVGATIALGATCPICYFVAPGLIAAGLWKRRKALKK